MSNFFFVVVFFFFFSLLRTLLQYLASIRGDCRTDSQLALFSDCSEFPNCYIIKFFSFFFHHLKSVVALKLYASPVCCFHAYIIHNFREVWCQEMLDHRMKKKQMREENMFPFYCFTIKVLSSLSSSFVGGFACLFFELANAYRSRRIQTRRPGCG